MNYLCVLGPDSSLPGGILEVSNQIVDYDMPMLKLKKIHIATASDKHKVWTFIKGVIKYIALCSNGKVSAVHINMSERRSIDRTKILIQISKYFHVKIFVHSHGSNFEENYNNMSLRSQEKLGSIMNYADRIIVLTVGWKKVWQQIVLEDKIRILPNGVNTKKDFTKEYFKKDRINILFLGIVGYRKGTYDLIDAVEILKERNCKISLKIGGNGEIEKCRKYVKERNLDDIVEVCGWVAGKNKRDLLDEADILALPSYFESFGIVLLEAMVNKVPVICGNKGYSKEVISDGVDGFVVTSGDVLSIADALNYFYFNPKIQEFGERGFKKVNENYGISTIMNSLQDIYIEVLKSN